MAGVTARLMFHTLAQISTSSLRFLLTSAEDVFSTHKVSTFVTPLGGNIPEPAETYRNPRKLTGTVHLVQRYHCVVTEHVDQKEVA